MAHADRDIELGSGIQTGHMESGNLPCLHELVSLSVTTNHQLEAMVTLEDYPAGYPRFAALIGAYAPFYICRRFGVLRARLLLLKQDEISVLEEQLEAIDRDESLPLFLGNHRRDRNIERRRVLSDIDDALANYDNFVDRTRKVLAYDAAKHQNVTSLQNWIEGNPDIIRTETDFLNKNDLIEVGASYDDALASFQRYVIKIMVHYFHGFRKMSFFDISRDSNVFIFSGSLLKSVVRILIVWLIVILLLTPIMIILVISSTCLRILFITMASAGFISAMSIITKAKTGELFLAGATYATVLVIFIVGNNSPA